MVAAAYTLDEFIHDMTELVASSPDQSALFDRGSAYLERLARHPESIPEQYRMPAPNARRAGGGSYVLHRGPGLVVTSVVWGAGHGVGPHDHRTWGMIGVLGNGIEETRYRRVDDRDREGHAVLVRDRRQVVKAGEVSLLIPDVDEIHSMANDTATPTVEIHVYGTDLVGLERHQFDLDTNTVRRFMMTRWDNC